MNKVNNIEIQDSAVWGKGLGFNFKEMSFWIDQISIDISRKDHSDTIDLPNGGKYRYTETTFKVEIDEMDFISKSIQVMDLTGMHDIEYQLSDLEVKEIISQVKDHVLSNIDCYVEEN